ncbi:MAG: hypothetical protein ACREB9_09105 [Thermoplasmata archaeon]
MSAPENPRIGDFVWHIHHDVLCELLTEPMESRIAFIKENKPMGEIETRLRLMKPVRNVRALLADAALSKARAAVSKARADLSTARADLSTARADWRETYADWSKADADWREAYADWSEADAGWHKACSGNVITALHAEECPNCPWNGRTIFS